MAKPNDIPLEVWTTAGSFTAKASETALRNLDQEDLTVEFDAIRTQIARAVIAERHACAELAQERGKYVSEPALGDFIGRAILTRGGK